MDNPHILFVYKQFPDPSVGHAGGESLFRLMNGLHLQGFKISLVAKITDEEKAMLGELEPICQKIFTTPHFKSIPGPRILAIPKSYLALRRLTRKSITEVQPDLIHVETTQSAVTLLGLRRPPTSYRTQDVNWYLYDQQMQRSAGIQKAILFGLRTASRWVETFLCRKFELILAISRGDQILLRTMCKNVPVVLVPLGTAMPESQQATSKEVPPSLLFVGDMSRKFNEEGVLWFLDNILPLILHKIPHVKMNIVGRKPSKTIEARADDTHIAVTGFVESLVPWYQKATLFVSPLLVAGGLLQKVLDAMYLGVPVVATSVCNHGLGAKPGVEIITADTDNDFAEAVLSLLEDQNRIQEIGEAGQAFVKANYNLEPALEDWAAYLQKILLNRHL